MCTLLQGVHGNEQLVACVESPLSLDKQDLIRALLLRLRSHTDFQVKSAV
jgi:hypothetical protein